ncbi:hypothetical protein LIER_11632 [Lithospermum erythrorhizon]|uniref:VQ domain-containing protein n=1 Tax=Lithospermum erythrorhizon TaxID=34254 RepID=A0AAV3PRQ7_LITER
MDDSLDNTSSRKSPRRELQGPRPAPLNVSKDSHKIKKPPVGPQPLRHHQPPPRAPVIIYTVSPKIIHANPNEFMTLVQRLTGPDNSSSSSPSSKFGSSSSTRSYFQEHQGGSGAISPAARFASIEKTKEPECKRSRVLGMQMIEDIEMNSKVERVSHLPSILSPNPSSLPPIPSNFFSPSSDANLLGFFSDLSPAALQSNKNYIDGSSILLPSPSNFITSPQMISPNIVHQALELFNSLFD